MFMYDLKVIKLQIYYTLLENFNLYQNYDQVRGNTFSGLEKSISNHTL